MKRYSFEIRKNQRKLKEARRIAKHRRHISLLKKTNKYKKKHAPDYRVLLKRLRNKIRMNIFREYDFRDEEIFLPLIDEIGIETKESFGNFISLGEKIIDSNASRIILDLRKCKRIWPSAITLLCSLIQWRTLAHKLKPKSFVPKVSSIKPLEDSLEEYLIHCGFYNYVGINKIKNKRVVYDEAGIVKIQCMVLPEILNNVTEHGKTALDQGWWIIGQYHKKHKFISICIADNGIGFRLNLITGPQKQEIEEKLENKKENDSNFIQLAFNEKISGAWSAQTQDKSIFRKKYQKGANRGNGLVRIKETCMECNIRLSVFSHYGYCVYDEKGNVDYKNFENRIFAGTMYNLIIPAK